MSLVAQQMAECGSPGKRLTPNEMCDNKDPKSPLMGFCGRIGVSLMLRYYKTQQWAKGRKVVKVLSQVKVNYSKSKDQVDISRYTSLFNSHLQACVDRWMLTVASDSADFMLSRKLPVDGAVLQMLLHKLGKQNLWLRAREVFRHSLTVGYYPAVSSPAGFMALIVPCWLGEVELALTFEMLIIANASVVLPLSETTPSNLSITLKRSREDESEYLSAGSRLLSAALMPQPKLEVRYTAVNPAREHVFTLSVASARHWLCRNHIWANELVEVLVKGWGKKV
ncbi:protein TOPAZ1 isoform X2 [Stigmatopora argus]